MVKYKSFCQQPKTFYGVTFRYGEIKDVPGYIHDPRFVCLGVVKTSESKPQLAPQKVPAAPKSNIKTANMPKLSKPAQKPVEKAETTKKEEPKPKASSTKAEKKEDLKTKAKEEPKTKAKEAEKKSADASTESDKKD